MGALLVEEYFPGISLRAFMGLQAIVIRTNPTSGECERFFNLYCDLYARIAEAVALVHEHGIAIGDMSQYNVMISTDGKEVKLIDFEGAHELGVDRPVHLFTIGFGSRERTSMPALEEDCYGLGALLLAGLFPMNPLIGLDPNAHARFLSSLTQDFGVPCEIKGTILELMDAEPSKRLRPRPAATLLRKARYTEYSSDAASVRATSIGPLVESITRYVVATATPDRLDRLFPADPQLFATNPCSVAYGACGVASALHRIMGSAPENVMTWICSRRYSPEAYPPGLYMGLSGIGWAFLEMGYRDDANRIFGELANHSLLYDCPDLFYGAAGSGLALLRFFLETQDDEYLARAVDAALFLEKALEPHEDGSVSWRSRDDTYFGLGHGASGIALFLLYFYLVTECDRYLELGRRALDFDLVNAQQTPDGGITWWIREHSRTEVPYWRYGSAGVGTTLVRYYRVTGDPRYLRALDAILVDTDRKYTIFPGRFFGLSGIGEFLLDMEQLLDGQGAHANVLSKIVSGLSLFQLNRPEGTAFPGEGLFRISCDFGTGAAGVAAFLHRLATNGRPFFMLDDLLPGGPDETVSAPISRVSAKST